LKEDVSPVEKGLQRKDQSSFPVPIALVPSSDVAVAVRHPPNINVLTVASWGHEVNWYG